MRLKAVSILLLVISFVISSIPIAYGGNESHLSVSFSCQQGRVIMESKVVARDKSENLYLPVYLLSPEGLVSLYLKLISVSMEGFYKGATSIGSCNYSYVVDMEFNGYFHSYAISGTGTSIIYSEQRFAKVPIYVTGSLTPTRNILSFEIYYDNTTDATVALTGSEIHFVTLLYSGDYLLYNSTYDVLHKFMKSIVRRDRVVIITPGSSKRLITLHIPLSKREMLRDTRLLVYIDRGKWSGGVLNMPLGRRVDENSIPVWAQPIINEFSRIGVIPWQEMSATVSRGDISLLLGSTLHNLYLFKGHPFNDVSIFDNSFTSISMLRSLGFVGGYPDGSFKPNVSLTRVEAAVFLLKYLYGQEILREVASYHVEGIFKDVDKESWYAPWVEIAFKKGLIKGYEDGTFRPNKFLTRLEAVVLVYRAYLLRK